MSTLCIDSSTSVMQMDLRFISKQGFVPSDVFSGLLGCVGVLNFWNEDYSFPQCALPQVAICS